MCCVVISILSAAVQAVTVQGWFDFVVLVFIAGNCITLAMERPTIPPWSTERRILTIANHVFTAVFALELAGYEGNGEKSNSFVGIKPNK